ncbi:hypothetical protein MPTK1_8g08460 [Marchantia polymorpha subsp. ruderalis]|uniref:CBS domain-containing protein n=1 Tax=Marchantia polymorpha TaxID=3197 RepID=A0A2R6WRP5_MARPO|nr:hypothetical protein MARPO_0063s0072 [Marchantia polymorpha]BBN19175.1 hypothetical protein Mp_8g08460 [Marchantia polymorpha subsp. ruderalis]|eukprot:PTQ36537.1 hypothetical protein MARPO_0063s0072 [Marchantia polymorpha]
MGECFQGVEAADLALGKPCLFPLSTTATVAQALKALKYNKDIAVLSVWVERAADELYDKSALPKTGGRAKDRYRCGGLITTLDIICFLACDESMQNPASALNSPLSVLYPSLSQAVEHVHGRTRLCQALDLMLNGVQHLVVPITKRGRKGKPLKIPGPLVATDLPAEDYWWITQEDVLRYLLGCIGVFYPLPMMSLEELGMINTNVLMVDENAEAISALQLIKQASQEMTAVAVVSGYSKDLRESSLGGPRPKLVGDVSTHTMRGCNEMAAVALATLSMKDFLLFVHDSIPPQFLVSKVRSKLNSKALTKSNPPNKNGSTPLRDLTTSACPTTKTASGNASFDDQFDALSQYSSFDEELSEYSSSDEELSGTLSDPPLELSSLSIGKLKSRTKPFHKGITLITCRPQSSLVAVMAQALAHRVNHVWITDEEGGLVGIVTYTDIIDVLLSQIHSLD